MRGMCEGYYGDVIAVRGHHVRHCGPGASEFIDPGGGSAEFDVTYGFVHACRSLASTSHRGLERAGSSFRKSSPFETALRWEISAGGSTFVRHCCLE